MSNSIYSGDSREEGDLDSDGAETPEVCATPRPGGMQREPPGPRSILVTHVTPCPADARGLNEKMEAKHKDKKTVTKTKSDSLTKTFKSENNAPSKTKKGEPPRRPRQICHQGSSKNLGPKKARSRTRDILFAVA